MERNEAIEVIKRNYPHVTESGSQFETALRTLIPELKESEDEMIRKAIGYAIGQSTHSDGTLINGVSSEEALAWLEKQGEKKSYTSETMNEKENFDNGFTRMMKNEQKPADKVEPKFHEGDWLIYENGSIYYVNKVYEHTYELVIDNGDKPRIPHELIDKKARFWAIQDAKPGDVLAVEPIKDDFQYPFVAIYKESGLGFFNSYCFIGFDGVLYEADSGHSIENVHPAAKEQRDFLFQKIHEAGYEWDAENRLLKKIESTNIPENFEKYVEHLLSLSDGEGHGSPAKVKEVSAKLFKLAKLEQSITWSEEDEIMLRRCISATFDHGYLKECDWLKSFKDRVQPQPKQEILEKLEEWLDAYISDLADVDTASLICSFTNYLDDKLLKSQKPADTY